MPLTSDPEKNSKYVYFGKNTQSTYMYNVCLCKNCNSFAQDWSIGQITFDARRSNQINCHIWIRSQLNNLSKKCSEWNLFGCNLYLKRFYLIRPISSWCANTALTSKSNSGFCRLLISSILGFQLLLNIFSWLSFYFIVDYIQLFHDTTKDKN